MLLLPYPVNRMQMLEDDDGGGTVGRRSNDDTDILLEGDLRRKRCVKHNCRVDVSTDDGQTHGAASKRLDRQLESNRMNRISMPRRFPSYHRPRQKDSIHHVTVERGLLYNSIAPTTLTNYYPQILLRFLAFPNTLPYVSARDRGDIPT
jgi:hypothetical protein